MRFKWSALIVPALLLACTTASADDGEKTLKEMTGGNTDNQLNVSPLDIGHHVSDAEHAFIDMMKFYVPSQDASGLVGTVLYNDLEGNPVAGRGRQRRRRKPRRAGRSHQDRER